MKLFLLLLVTLLLSACGTTPVAPFDNSNNPVTLERGSYVAQTTGVCQGTNEEVGVTVRIQSLEQQPSGEYTLKLLFDFGTKADFGRADFQDVTLSATSSNYQGDIMNTEFGKQYDRGDFVITPGVKDAEGYPTLDVAINVAPIYYEHGFCYDMANGKLQDLNVSANFRKLRQGEPYPNQAPQ